MYLTSPPGAFQTPEQARGGLEALASAGTSRSNVGFAPRDGSGGTGGGTAAEMVGGLRVAVGPPPSAPAVDGLGLGSGRWERESRVPSSPALPEKHRKVGFEVLIESTSFRVDETSGRRGQRGEGFITHLLCLGRRFIRRQ